MENKTLWAVSVSGSIRSIGFGATWPFMAIFFNRDLGVPILLVGIIFTLLAISSIAFSVVGGWLADKFGRRVTLLVGGFNGILIYSLISVFIAVHLSVLFIAAGFVLSSSSGSLIFPSSTALVSDVTSRADRTIAYGIYRILTNVGWAIGPIMGAYVYDLGMEWIFAIIATSSLIQFLVILFFVHDRRIYTRKTRTKVSMISYDRYLILFSVGTFFIMMISTQFSVTLPTFAANHVGIPVSAIGYIFAVNGAVVVLGQYPLNALFSRVSDVTTMIIGSLFYSAGYLLVGFSGSLLQLMLDMIVITVGEDLVSPSLNSIVSKIAPEDRVARFMSFNGMVNSAARAIGPSVGTIFLSLYLYNGPEVWGTIDIFGITSIVILIFFGRLLRARQSPERISDTQDV
ncbi:MAG: MFS transporter [Candidatus Thermoplasmatota archaeon]|nr:MFS transporter [Candidatus Thermoplasmatota archaeon]